LRDLFSENAIFNGYDGTLIPFKPGPGTILFGRIGAMIFGDAFNGPHVKDLIPDPSDFSVRK
jgi:hypothetical protein